MLLVVVVDVVAVAASGGEEDLSLLISEAILNLVVNLVGWFKYRSSRAAMYLKNTRRRIKKVQDIARRESGPLDPKTRKKLGRRTRMGLHRSISVFFSLL